MSGLRNLRVYVTELNNFVMSAIVSYKIGFCNTIQRQLSTVNRKQQQK